MKSLRLPLALFAAPAVLLRLVPDHTASLVLDRAAVWLGEPWRLWTGHWVHFSGSHLLWNLTALLAAGAWLERARPGWLLRHTFTAAPLISLGLLALEPAMGSYGGLSALATSVVTLLALEQLRVGRADRAFWIALLLFVSGKILLEAGESSALLARFDSADIRPSRFAHATGALMALGLWPFWRRNAPPPPAENDPAGIRDGVPAGRFRCTTPNHRRDTQT